MQVMRIVGGLICVASLVSLVSCASVPTYYFPGKEAVKSGQSAVVISSRSYVYGKLGFGDLVERIDGTDIATQGTVDKKQMIVNEQIRIILAPGSHVFEGKYYGADSSRKEPNAFKLTLSLEANKEYFITPLNENTKPLSLADDNGICLRYYQKK